MCATLILTLGISHPFFQNLNHSYKELFHEILQIYIGKYYHSNLYEILEKLQRYQLNEIRSHIIKTFEQFSDFTMVHLFYPVKIDKFRQTQLAKSNVLNVHKYLIV